MALAPCELVWIKQLLQELKFCEIQQIRLYCDNQAILHIVSSPIFYERTKCNAHDCQLIGDFHTMTLHTMTLHLTSLLVKTLH